VKLESECLLPSFYDNGDLRTEVFRGIPQRIAKTLQGAGMTRTSTRRFYNVVRRAYDRYRVDPKRRFGPSREMIESLEPLVAYSQTREGGTPPCFSTFIKHYVDLAVREERNLRGFKYLFQSVVAFITRK
jgi:CRISPR type III-A-associated protein Csm2